MDRRKFIGTCACCAFASAGAVLLSGNNLTKENSNSIQELHDIGIHITEHCNLQCKYCFHFSCIAEEEFYELNKFEQDVARMSYLLNKKLTSLQLFGGEPLLNPQINEYVKISRKYFPKTNICVVTNAILLDDMDEKFWKTLNENNVTILPSIYPIEINWKSILDKAKKYSVGIYGDYIRTHKITLDNIDNFRKDTFLKMSLSKNKYVNIDHSKCNKKVQYQHLYNGKFYPCYFISTVRHLNNKFKTNFIVTENDYIDIYKAKNADDIKNFILNTPQFPFCKYCSLEYKKVKWQNSQVHSLDEWT